MSAFTVVLLAVIFLLVILLIVAIVRGQRRPVAIGKGTLVGQVGTVRKKIDPEGTVHVDGALWAAVCDERTVPVGEEVVVVEELRGMKLKVKRAQ